MGPEAEDVSGPAAGEPWVSGIGGRGDEQVLGVERAFQAGSQGRGRAAASEPRASGKCWVSGDGEMKAGRRRPLLARLPPERLATNPTAIPPAPLH
jgi:hypothetical protein